MSIGYILNYEADIPPVLGDYEQSGYHLCSSFYVYINFDISRVKTKKLDCWVIW